MLNGFEHGLQVFARALGTARQIDDQARAANARCRARQTRLRRNLHGRCPHRLRDTRRELFADLDSRLRRYIARCKAGAAGGDDECELLLVGGMDKHMADGEDDYTWLRRGYATMTVLTYDLTHDAATKALEDLI